MPEHFVRQREGDLFALGRRLDAGLFVIERPDPARVQSLPAEMESSVNPPDARRGVLL